MSNQDPAVQALRMNDKVKQLQSGRLAYYCPGCKDVHTIPAKIGVKDVGAWQWNGSTVAPTVTPSVNVNPSHPEVQCHHFVTDGNIVYCGDCHHELKGQTVELPLVKDTVLSQY